MSKIRNLKDQLYMSPLRKYEIYGKFPWKLVIQILLMIFTACQVLIIINDSTSYSYNQYTLWNKIFLNKDVEGKDTSIANTFNIYGSTQLKSYIKQTVDNYYDINSHTIDNYEYHYQDNGDKKPVKMLVEYYDYTKAFKKGYEIEYLLSNNDLGPFAKESLHEYLDQVIKFELRFTLIHNLNKHMSLFNDCYEWNILQIYDYSAHGHIKASLKPTRKSCGDANCKDY